MTTSKNTIRLLNKRLAANNYYSLVAVEFLPQKENTLGVIAYLSEAQIRALMLEVALLAKNEGWEAAEQFTSTFIVYNGRYKKNSTPMVWDKENPGKFVTDFKPGFMDICDNLSIQLFCLNS